MDLCRVRYFLAVCEHGTFTAAAKVCGVSQPAVTTGVSRLERALGGKLFERRHPVRLTPLGMQMRPLLEALQSAAACVRAAVEKDDARAIHTAREAGRRYPRQIASGQSRHAGGRKVVVTGPVVTPTEPIPRSAAPSLAEPTVP